MDRTKKEAFVNYRHYHFYIRMHPTIEKILGFRHYLLSQLDGLTARQLNHIPAGCSNNLIWNLAHLSSTMQTMCYVRSGLPLVMEEQYSPFLPGTKPEKFLGETKIETIRNFFLFLPERLQSDLDKQFFKEYSPSVMIPKVYGFEIGSIEDALAYLLYHEGYHAGCMLSMKRWV